jgi:TolB-like protein/class 3 adenylate cyclase/Tfp pilus assembly protein PilF
MPAEPSSEVKLEIGHVLFIDIVGYSKLLINEQSEQIQKLKQIVRGTEEVRKAEAEGKLLRLPTGDGGALVFRNSPEAPVLCAMEISREFKKHPELRVRMGIHSGPVNEITDLNEQANIAGAGINIAQRVMDCGDAGHILLSRHVAEDLEHYPRWQPYLHPLGDCEVKHGARVSVTNLYSDEVGNANLPSKLQAVKKHHAHVRWAAVAIGLLVVAALAAGVLSFLRKGPARSLAAAVEKSIAVLPFENLSEEKQNEYFTDGVQDEILTYLAKIADLKVISRMSVMQYKSGAPRNLREIAQQLGVANVVEGSVQRSGNRVRVNAQLIDARNDAHLWAQTYDRDLADVFAIQSEIAKAIADQLQAKLSPAEKNAIEQRPTSDLTAFDQYSRAKTLILTSSLGSGDKNLPPAIELLNSAVARDPSFHAGFCQLVFAHDQLYAAYDDHTPPRLAAAEAALQRAIELRPNAAETHLARGSHLYYAFRDYKGALSELEAARAGLANDPRILQFTGSILCRQGKPEEGVRALEQAVALDPRNPYMLSRLAISYECLRRYPEEKATLQRVLEITPDDIAVASSIAFVDLDWHADTAPLHQFIDRLRSERRSGVGDTADIGFLCALAERDWAAAEQALTALGNNPFWGDLVTLRRQFGEGLLARAMHDEGRAQKAFAAARVEQEQLVQQQKDYGPPVCVLGLIDAALGNKEAALQEGRRAMELLPVEKDAIDGQAVVGYFAIIAAWVGEKDLALQQLAAAAPTYGAAIATSYGMLKLFPFWDPLRGDPRFEKIVTSLAPKDAKH